jgi:hypothetical protein
MVTTNSQLEVEDQEIPPMPGREAEGSSSPLTSSASPESPGVVSEQLAADLIGLPFQLWATFETRVDPEVIELSEKTKSFLGGPVARILERHGLGHIAKDEIVVFSALGIHTFVVFREIRKAKAQVIKADKGTGTPEIME